MCPRFDSWWYHIYNLVGPVEYRLVRQIFILKSRVRLPAGLLRSLSSAGSERLPYKQRVGGSNPSATTLIDLSFPTKEDFKLFEKFDIRQVVQFLGRASAKSFTVNEFRFDLMAKTVLR